MSYPNPAAAYQGQRCTFLAGFLNFVISDPLVSPYTAASYVTPLITGLGTMNSQLQAGTLNPTQAGLQISVYVHTYAPIVSYYFTTEMIADLQLYTNINGGSNTLWNDLF